MTDGDDATSFVCYDEETDTYRATHRDSGAEELSTSVILAYEAAANGDPGATTPLFERIDPDALDSLFDPLIEDSSQSGILDGKLTFTIDQFRITVYASGDICILPPEQSR